MPRLPAFVLASLLTHFLAAWFLNSRTLEKRESETVEFEIAEKMPAPPPPPGDPNSKSTAKGGKKGTRGTPPKSFRVRPGLRRFLPQGDVTFETGSLASTRNLTNEGELGLAEEDWGSHADPLGQLVNYLNYNRIFEDLQNMLNYPVKLCYHRISGTVNSRLHFTEDSECDWKRSKIYGAHPYLRLYSLTLLRKLCSLSSVKQMGLKPSQFVDISFNFNIVRTPETFQQQAGLDRILGNVLMLYRSCFVPPQEVEMGPLKVDLLSQMAFINFPWIFENWEKYVEGKDPLKEFKE